MGKRSKAEPERREFKGFPHVKARLKRGEQAKMANALRVSEGFLSQVLSGDRGHTPEFAEKMADYLGTTVDGLNRAATQADLLGFINQLDQDQSRRALIMLEGAFGDRRK